MSATPSMRLISCRDCASALLQLEAMWLLPDGRSVARRWCPECGRVDTVTANPLALAAWRRASARQRGVLVASVLELIGEGADVSVPDEMTRGGAEG
jgi:hypothetical protein